MKYPFSLFLAQDLCTSNCLDGDKTHTKCKHIAPSRASVTSPWVNSYSCDCVDKYVPQGANNGTCTCKLEPQPVKKSFPKTNSSFFNLFQRRLRDAQLRRRRPRRMCAGGQVGQLPLQGGLLRGALPAHRRLQHLVDRGHRRPRRAGPGRHRRGRLLLEVSQETLFYNNI